MKNKSLLREFYEHSVELLSMITYVMIALMATKYQVYWILPFCIIGVISTMALFSLKVDYEIKCKPKKVTVEQLIKKYPKIFQDYQGNPGRCNWYGCPDGWLPIIDDLCGSIQDYIDNTTHYVNNEKIKPTQVTCTQLKEKYGQLRFYCDGADDIVDGMIRMAEYLCDNTCEVCQTHDNLGYTQGWISVKCETCKGDSKWKQK